MSAARTLALLNFLIITVNFTWIILIDNSFFYGHSIHTAINSYPTYLSPDSLTFKIWSFLAANMILVGVLMYRDSRNPSTNERTLKKIERIDNLLIINQLLCGISIVLKLNDYFISSVICSLGCLFTVLLINKRIEIHKLVSNSITRYFIRLGFGVYTGWMIMIATFNSVILLTKYELIQNSVELFWLNLAVVAIAVSYGIYYTITHNLPAVSAVLAWGLFGIIIKHIKDPQYVQPDIKPYLYILFFATVCSTIYGFYRCNVRRSLPTGINETPPSIT